MSTTPTHDTTTSNNAGFPPAPGETLPKTNFQGQDTESKPAFEIFVPSILKGNIMQNQINAHLKHPVHELAITAVLVTSDDERMKCLPAIAGMRCVMLEQYIYRMMDEMCADYKGGFWDFYKLSNGGFYMAPQFDGTFDLACTNYFHGTVSAQTAGIISCALAYNHLSFRRDGDCFNDAYILLSDFIFQHPDAGMIRRALD